MGLISSYIGSPWRVSRRDRKTDATNTVQYQGLAIFTIIRTHERHIQLALHQNNPKLSPAPAWQFVPGPSPPPIVHSHTNLTFPPEWGHLRFVQEWSKTRTVRSRSRSATGPLGSECFAPRRSLNQARDMIDCVAHHFRPKGREHGRPNHSMSPPRAVDAKGPLPRDKGYHDDLGLACLLSNKGFHFILYLMIYFHPRGAYQSSTKNLRPFRGFSPHASSPPRQQACPMFV